MFTASSPKQLQPAITVCTRAARDERGAVAMIFAITLMAAIMAMACAIDYARISLARSSMTSAIDASVLYAAKQIREKGASLATAQTLARALFDQNTLGISHLVTIKSFDVAMTPDGNGVTLSTTADVPMSFARVAGINTITIPVDSTAVVNSQALEVAMQLDVTGSMNDTINGVAKIDSLKAATKNLLNILLPAGGTGTTSVRVGIAPFSAGVNAGSYASTVAGKTAPGNCVYERKIASADNTDEAPTGSATLLTSSDLGRGAQGCPSAAVVQPLTTNASTLVNVVNRFVAGGTTAGHLGTAWAWYLLSPNWSSIWPTASEPAAYRDASTRKFAIIETDGIYNTVKGSDLGDYSSTAVDSQTRAKATCQAMKDDGIEIYAVGFIKVGDDPSAANTLMACASDPAHFFKAQDGAELDAAFQAIAKDISRLRLTH